MNTSTPISTLLILLCLNAISLQLFSQVECREVEVIVSSQEESVRNINPSISCDGETIVWRGNDRTTNLIYRADCDAHVTLVSTETVFNTSPQISADGSTIVWSGFTVDDNFQTVNQDIYVSIDGGPQTLVNPVTTNGTSINNITPQVCADGSKIVWKGFINGGDHVFMNDGSQTTQISTPASTRNTSPEISNDCSVITWMGFDTNTDAYQIYRYENGVVSEISSPNGSVKSYNQVLSDNGQVIVWIGTDQNENDQIYMYIDNQITQITQNMPGRHMYPSVSNDGTTISWSSYDALTSTTTIYVYTPSGIVLLESYVISSANPVFLKTSVSESGNTVVWADPNDNIVLHSFSDDQTEILATQVNLFDQDLIVSCNEQVVVWSSYVTDAETNLNRSICSPDFCQPTNLDNAAIVEPIVDPIDASVPTMGEWGLICLGLLFLIFGIQSIKETEGSFTIYQS